MLILLVLFTSGGLTWGQYSADPYNTIYEDIDLWHGMGYITQLPIFRPLPEVKLASLMEEVIERGDAKTVLKAKKHLLIINKFRIHNTISLFGRINSVGGDIQTINRAYGNGVYDVYGSIRINDFISIATSIGGHLLADKDADDLAYIRNTYFAYKSMNRMEELENIKIGTFASINASVSFTNRTSIGIGSEDFFVHAGFMRRSIGPFFDDGIMVSPKAPQSPNIFVYWRGKGKKLTANWGIFSLSSSRQYIKFEYQEDSESTTGYTTPVTERSTENKINKFFIYESFTWNPSEKFELAPFQAIMFGNFNLGYILPIKMMYAIDSGSDFTAGNLYTGFTGKYKPLPTLTFPFSFVLDDISISNYIKFNFYSKLKAAAEVGGEWHPRNDIFKTLKIGYQIVTPYTYTHPPTETYELYSTAYNTENHTHMGQNLATSLQPNSHKLYLITEVAPLEFLTIETILTMKQHANASYGILQGPLNDGSIVDDGYRSVYDAEYGSDSISFTNRFDFLSLGNIETTLEAGLNLGLLVPVARKIKFFADINYTYKYIINYNLSLDTKIEGIFQTELGMSILF